jgi:hypothetical protein
MASSSGLSLIENDTNPRFERSSTIPPSIRPVAGSGRLTVIHPTIAHGDDQRQERPAHEQSRERLLLRAPPRLGYRRACGALGRDELPKRPDAQHKPGKRGEEEERAEYQHAHGSGRGEPAGTCMLVVYNAGALYRT